MYNLGGTDLSVIDFIPVRQDGSNIALSGFLDMPARLGKTFHSWANENGIEPYVSAEEIFFGGRDLKLSGIITGADLYACNGKLDTLYSLIDNFIGTVPLITDYGTYQVYVNAPVTGEYMPRGGDLQGIRVTIPFREQSVYMSSALPAAGNAGLGIDGISFAALGGAFLQLSGDRLNRTAPKKMDVTAYGKEIYIPTRKEVPVLNLKLGIKSGTYAEMHDKVYELMALFKSPGLRTLTVNNDRLRSFFVKDGFTVSMIHVEPGSCACVIDCKLTESGAPGVLDDLADNLGNLIIDNTNNIIKVRI